MALNFRDAMELAYRGERVARPGWIDGRAVVGINGVLVVQQGEIDGEDPLAYIAASEDVAATDWDYRRSLPVAQATTQIGKE
jgi:hypothetical protein